MLDPNSRFTAGELRFVYARLSRMQETCEEGYLKRDWLGFEAGTPLYELKGWLNRALEANDARHSHSIRIVVGDIMGETIWQGEGAKVEIIEGGISVDGQLIKETWGKRLCSIQTWGEVENHGNSSLRAMINGTRTTLEPYREKEYSRGMMA